jgi:hypothetical protein
VSISADAGRFAHGRSGSRYSDLGVGEELEQRPLCSALSYRALLRWGVGNLTPPRGIRPTFFYLLRLEDNGRSFIFVDIAEFAWCATGDALSL